MNVKEFWNGIRREASVLDPVAAEADARETERGERKHLERSRKEIWMISVAREEVGSVPGQVVSTVPIIAARWLREGTHILATEEQVTAHKADQARRKEQIEKEEADRKGVPTSKLLEALVAAQQPRRGKE